MSAQETSPSEATRPRGAVDWCRRNIHFLVAAVILLGTTIVWNRTVEALDWALQKYPVAWPEGVVVDAETFSVVSFPERIGPYVLASDGELQRNEDDSPKTDGRPDGNIIIERDDVLDSLKIATHLDKWRLSERKSNWYAIRLLRDTRVPNPARRSYGYWRLEVYYYTGGLDTVPHIPEVCGLAAGAIPDRSKWKTVHLSSPEGTPAPWGGRVPFKRIWFQHHDKKRGTTEKLAQYYTFSLNGRPEESWKAVRLTLTKPWVRYCYFAKIQISPLGGVGSPDETDEAAGRFFQAVCPELLKLLPMPEDIDKQAGSPKAAESPR